MGGILVIFGKCGENRRAKDQAQHVGRALYMLFLRHFFQSAKCCETLTGATLCQKVFNYVSISFIALRCPVALLTYAIIINASSSSLL